MNIKDGEVARIAGDIREERARQIMKGMDAEHDDGHTAEGWRDLLICYTWKAWLNLTLCCNTTTLTQTEGLRKARQQLVQVASLAVAAIQAIDRRLARIQGHHKLARGEGDE